MDDGGGGGVYTDVGFGTAFEDEARTTTNSELGLE